jgi:hypothetical protein
MTTPPRPKLPIVCFILLGATLFLGGLGTLGGGAYLFAHFPAGTPLYAVPVLALNGVLAWTLAVLSGLSAWKLARQTPKARGLARVTWALVAGFALWTLLFDGLLGWSLGGILEVLIWTVLEALLASHWVKTRRADRA